jgi:hypothetical protein
LPKQQNYRLRLRLEIKKAAALKAKRGSFAAIPLDRMPGSEVSELFKGLVRR